MQRVFSARGRAGGRGSGRGPPLGRRGGHEHDRLLPVGGAVDARPAWRSRKGSQNKAERDAHDALACAAEVEAYLLIPDILECLAALAGDAGSHREAARLFGAAHAIRERMGAVRLKVWDAGYQAVGGGAARRVGRERL